ncbi:E3 ubiquitin-protein ligase TRIM21-like [Poecilia reticulata]|uniref:E3 ubiquitin-protein ligase TRIM21-like n=1 Tax=Poecilia reticulata TaxID=8081 RepID=UPI0007EA961D|nr:PREDICTED: E3 ubiquitin-protein ligase TRIM21-like [Poecilia reticulata]
MDKDTSATPEKQTGAKMKAEDVLKALDDLSEDELKRFEWFLLQPETIPGLPPIKKGYLKKTKSLNIVDVMMHTYTLERCMEVTSKILEKIQRNDLLQILIKDWRRKTEAEVQEMIQERRLKIQEIRETVKISRDAADREKAEGVQVFSVLMESAERGLKELLKEIQDKQEATEKEAEDFIRDLEQEISELKKRSSEVNFHQSFSSLREDPPNKNWVEDRVHPPSYEGTVERAVAQLEEKMKKMLEMRRVQQFAVDVTLDPDTAHLKLILSDDRKQVKHGNDWKKLPDNPERFSKCVFVLAEQSFSSGRFYFEVQVKGKTDWDLGVVRESVDRKEILPMSTKNGFWTLVLRNENRYSTGEKTSKLFDLHPGPEKVGVFVDYEEGLVSFYDVDAAALIYSFTGCCFKEKLYPFFSPYLNNGGKNSAPLIICPVSQAGR